MENLCALEVPSSQVSRATAALDEELSAWRTRPLVEVPYLVLDARYENVRHAGSVVRCALLVAVGVVTSWCFITGRLGGKNMFLEETAPACYPDRGIQAPKS